MGAAEEALTRHYQVESAATQHAESREDQAMLATAEQIHGLAPAVLGTWAVKKYTGGELLMLSTTERKSFGKFRLQESEIAGLKIATWSEAAGLSDLRDDPDYYLLSTGEIARRQDRPERLYRHSENCNGGDHVEAVDLSAPTWGGTDNDKSSRKRALAFMLQGMKQLAQN